MCSLTRTFVPCVGGFFVSHPRACTRRAAVCTAPVRRASSLPSATSATRFLCKSLRQARRSFSTSTLITTKRAVSSSTLWSCAPANWTTSQRTGRMTTFLTVLAVLKSTTILSWTTLTVLVQGTVTNSEPLHRTCGRPRSARCSAAAPRRADASPRQCHPRGNATHAAHTETRAASSAPVRAHFQPACASASQRSSEVLRCAPRPSAGALYWRNPTRTPAYAYGCTPPKCGTSFFRFRRSASDCSCGGGEGAA